jgi:branched-subunit amino acid ABC-type transport system permease component
LLALMQESISLLFGTSSEPVRPFTFAAVRILGTAFGVEQLVVGGVGFAAVGGYWAWIRYSRFGLVTRAVAQDREVAGLLGIAYGRVFTLNFAVGAALAGLAGSLVATIQPVSAFSASGPTFTAFTVIIIGTLGSIPGVIVAGALLGVVQDLGVTFLSADFASLYPFVLVLLVLVIKPAGLFGGRSLKVRAG